MQNDEHNFIIHMMDGRAVNVCTESGANEFLQGGSYSKTILSDSLERMSSISAKQRLNANDTSILEEKNILFASVSRCAHTVVFGKNVERKMVKAWLDYATKR